MANFVIYNYQFARIIEPEEQYQIQFPGWEAVDVEESFARRQEILDEVLDCDYKNTFQFVNKRGWEYWHKQIAEPQDGVYVMRVANVRSLSITNEQLKEEIVKDYRNCLVIIDNRKGMQRIAIEKKTKVFQRTQTVAGILQATLNVLLKRYRLKVILEAPYPKQVFWQVVREHPKGFKKITFHFPHLNLDRLTKVMDGFLTDVRKDWSSDLEFSFGADDGGSLDLETNKARKEALVEGASAHGTSDREGTYIIMYPKDGKRIFVGKGHYVEKELDDSVFEKLVGDQAMLKNMATTPFDKVKNFMKNLPDVFE